MATNLPKPPRPAALYVRYVVAIGVSVAVGLAPLIGKYGVPGFVPIVRLFPLNLREPLIAFAAFLMAIPAAAVQYYAGEKRISAKRLQKWFLAFLLSAGALAFILFTVLQLVTVDVPYQGTNFLRYVVATYDSDCVCAKLHIPPQKCVGRVPGMTTSPADVDSCFVRGELVRNKLFLSLPYLLMMTMFGSMIGVLAVRDLWKPQPQHLPRPPRKPRTKD